MDIKSDETNKTKNILKLVIDMQTTLFWLISDTISFDWIAAYL